MMLPAVLDPWAGHALYEAANLAKNQPGSKVWLVSLGPKAKLQQVMMTVAQKVPFELVALDGPASGFTDAAETAAALADAIQAIPGLDKSRLLVFGGWESASRGAGATMQMVGERLGIVDQFQGVDELKVERRWFAGNSGAHRRRQTSDFQMRWRAGVAWLGHGQFAGTKKQSAGGHGQHAHRDARVAKGQAGETRRRGLELRQRGAAQTIARNPNREGQIADDIAQEIVEWIKK